MADLKERREMDPAYMWDLGSLFSSDEEFRQALEKLDPLIRQAAAFRGNLNTAKQVREFLDQETGLMRKLNNAVAYASLRRSEDTRDPQGQSMFAAAYAKAVAAESALSFFRPELLEQDAEWLDALVRDPLLADYRFLLEDLIRSKAHTLDAGQEEVLARLGEVLASPGQTANALMDADLVFDPAEDSEGKCHEVSGSGYILLQSSTDRTLRKHAFDSFYKGYRQHINTFAQTYNGCVKAAVAESAMRGYDSSREMALSGDNIPISVYDNLIDTVRSRMDLMYRYVRLRKRLLGLDELHYYDVYAPLVRGPEKRYSWREAQEMVKRAVAPLGRDYAVRVQEAFDGHWIDVYPNKGKRGGAFSGGTYDSNPFILTNFTGTLDSVSTIAHEMGHSQHTWLANHAQPAQYAGYSLFVAEVASTVNENLLIEQLLKNEQEPGARLALLNQYLEGFKGTVYRQTMFAEFERDAHAMAERGEALTPESLNALYGKLLHDYFGEDLIVDPEAYAEWARIPHFYRPFYVYVYATGYCSAAALSEKILTGEDGAARKYLEFLSMGGSQYPLDELRHGGIDLATPAPVNAALDKFEEVIEDAERTADHLNG